MKLPFFYISEYDSAQKEMALDEETSKHVVQVLRMKVGEVLNLTDGKGNLLTCEIKDDHKKHCQVSVISKTEQLEPARKITIAISLLKNTNRFEWFLEKATEIGVTNIIPLLCERTEKEKFRPERLQGIVTSALLQSEQTWLPVLHAPTPFEKLPEWKAKDGVNYIAHCMEGGKSGLTDQLISQSPNRLICIGPEGDFTEQEIELALLQGFIPVTLGETRLRTETAGVVAAALLANTIS